MPRKSKIICLRIFAFTTPFRFINQRTCGDLYSQVLVFVLRVILMTPNHLLFHCHHSPFSEQAAGCPIRTFSFHLHTRLLWAVYNFKAHTQVREPHRYVPMHSLAYVHFGMWHTGNAVHGTILFVGRFANYEHDGRNYWPTAVTISKTVPFISLICQHARTHTGLCKKRLNSTIWLYG
jgi:hypothetical protein